MNARGLSRCPALQAGALFAAGPVALAYLFAGEPGPTAIATPRGGSGFAVAVGVGLYRANSADLGALEETDRVGGRTARRLAMSSTFGFAFRFLLDAAPTFVPLLLFGLCFGLAAGFTGRAVSR